MEIINGTSLSEMCDYSFGDHLSLPDPDMTVRGHFKQANAHNLEFIEKCRRFEGRIMSLFIDNIRLYPRPVKTDSEDDENWVNYMMNTNNLLGLCSLLPANAFVIFTSHEDTPIDEHIVLPPNVLHIYATNAIFNDERIIPFPYGLQRPLGQDDHRLEIMKENLLKSNNPVPNKLLYINCGIGRNKDREPLAKFETNEWITTRFDKDSKFFPYERYQDFLNEIKDHKFMICPWGHGIDCHRNWESLYLRRVPIMKDHPYFRRLMKGFPILFIKDWSDITKELLETNDHLFREAQNMALDSLDLAKIFKRIINNYSNSKIYTS